MTATLISQDLLALQDNLLRFAYRLTADADEARDLVQETSLRCLENADKFAEGTNFAAWITTLMRNIFINSYRRIVSHGILLELQPELYQPVADSGDEGRDTIPGCLVMADIRRCLARCPRSIRDPFVLYASGWQYDEIAARMNIPLGTVKSRIFMARRKLRAGLAEYDPDYSPIH